MTCLPPPVAHPTPPAFGLVFAMLEALVGRRPLHQVRTHLTGEAFRELVAYTDAGLLQGSAIGRVRVQMPSPRTVEATASVQVGARWLACSLRLEDRSEWQCRAIHVLGLPARQVLSPA